MLTPPRPWPQPGFDADKYGFYWCPDCLGSKKIGVREVPKFGYLVLEPGQGPCRKCFGKGMIVVSKGLKVPGMKEPE